MPKVRRIELYCSVSCVCLRCLATDYGLMNGWSGSVDLIRNAELATEWNRISRERHNAGIFYQ